MTLTDEQLDAIRIRVAVEIFGYQWRICSIGPDRIRTFCQPNMDDEIWDGNEDVERASENLGLIPDYPRSIKAAWQVREKVRTWLFSRRQRFIRALEAQKENPAWNTLDWLFFVEDNLPVCICLAALEACENQTAGGE